MTSAGSICIAGYRYGLFLEAPRQLVFETGFQNFLSAQTSSVDYELHLLEGFIDLTDATSIYKAVHQEKTLWEIVAHQNEQWFLVYHPQTGELQQQAQYDAPKNKWRIRSLVQQLEQEEVLHPLAYPMAPLIWYVLTTEKDLLLVHASGVFDGQEGRIFAGFSGVGKSTLACIWERNGAQVINDDRLLLKKEKDGSWQIYNTPMYYSAPAKNSPLNAIYFPFHQKLNTIEPLSGARAIAQLLAFTIHHGYNPQHLLHHSRIAEILLNDLPAFKLGVVPTDEIIPFIRAHE